MIGFEVKINDIIVEAAVENGVVTVIFDRLKKPDRDETNLNIGGLNSDTHEHLKWLAHDLKVGDSINILVKEIAQPSASTKKINTES